MADLTNIGQIRNTESKELNVLRDSRELFEFYQALAALQPAAIRFIQMSKDVGEMKKRLVTATQALQMMRQNDFQTDCPPPSVWDPVTETCV